MCIRDSSFTGGVSAQPKTSCSRPASTGEAPSVKYSSGILDPVGASMNAGANVSRARPWFQSRRERSAGATSIRRRSARERAVPRSADLSLIHISEPTRPY